MKSYKLEGWFYEGNHTNGQDSIKHSDMDALARDLGISAESVYYDVRGALRKAGQSVNIKGKTIVLKTLKVGKKDGFGRNRLEVYEVQ